MNVIEVKPWPGAGQEEDSYHIEVQPESSGSGQFSVNVIEVKPWPGAKQEVESYM